MIYLLIVISYEDYENSFQQKNVKIPLEIQNSYLEIFVRNTGNETVC